MRSDDGYPSMLTHAQRQSRRSPAPERKVLDNSRLRSSAVVGQAAVRRDGLPGDEPSGGRGQEHHNPDEILRHLATRQALLAKYLLSKCGCGIMRAIDLGRRGAGSNAVDRDPEWAQLSRQRIRHAD